MPIIINSISFFIAMKRDYNNKAEKFKRIAKERIEILFDEAKKIFSYDPKLSDRYVFLARKIAMKYKVGIPPELKRRFCKHCHSFFMHSKNCRVRTADGKVIYYCLSCKKYTRYPFIKEQKEKRKKYFKK